MTKGEEERGVRGAGGSSGDSSPPPIVVLTDTSIDPHVVMYHDPKSILAEHYRAFRTNMLAMDKGRSSRALTITSSVKGEGKSLSAVNIAICLAEAPGLKVCLIDADFRAPRIADYLGLGEGPGLSDLLIDDLNLEEVLLETKVQDLFVIRAGREPRNPAELLGSERIRDLMAVLKTDFTHIICDTPPINPYTDAAVLGSRMDGVIFVVRMNRTGREQAQRASDVLRSAGNNIIGTFLTDTPPVSGKEADYYRRLEE